MNEKQLATRLRDILNTSTEDVDYELQQLVDELDPPAPEPGTVVWYWLEVEGIWKLAIVSEHNPKFARPAFGENVYLPQLDWKPARILGPRQVAVDVPPLPEWPPGSLHLEVAITGGERDKWIATLMTRDRAERMEARDE